METPAPYGSHSQPGTWRAVAKPPRDGAGMRDMGRQACPWPLAPTPPRHIPLAHLRLRPPPLPLLAPAGDHHSSRPYPRPYPHPALYHPTSSPPPAPPPTPDSRRTSTSPGASRPPPGPAAAAPQEGGRRGMGGLRPVVVKAARGCHCGQQRFAPGDGGGGLNRAWAGGAGSRGPLAQCCCC